MSDFKLAEHWWEADKNDAHGRVFETIRDLEQRSSNRRISVQQHLGLYLDKEISEFDAVISERAAPLFGEPQRLNLNVVKSCIDTVAAKIASHHPRPMFTTEDGLFKDRKKAKGLERWVDGLFYREKLHTEEAPKVFFDAAITGTGCLKVFKDPEENEVRMERVWIDQIYIDEISSLFALPRAMQQKMFIARDVLLSQFPKFKDEIRGLQNESDNTDGGQLGLEDVVEVVESWHLPSGKKAKDGRRTICVSSATLVDEPYVDDDFPFVFFRWSRQPLGFYGGGLAEELHGLQVEIKKLLNRIQEAMKLAAVVVIMKPAGTDISDDHFTNQNGLILEYSGPRPPEYVTPASMNSQVFQHLWRLRDAAYQISGISQLSASGTKPAGIESGVALRTLNDFETQRFALLSRDWEEFYINVTRRSVKLAKSVYRSGSGEVKWADRGTVKAIKWSDVNLEEDSYVLRIYPANMLPQTPSGKLATVGEMMERGLITPDIGKSLLDFPDIEKFANLANVALEDLIKIFDSIWEDEDYLAPTPEMHLELGVKLATSYYLKAHMDNAPQQIRDAYVRWIEEAKDLMAPPPEMGPEGAMPPPPGAEMPMPPEGIPGMEAPPDVPMASPADAASQVLAPPPPVALP